MTEYVREQFNRAEALQNDRRAGTVGFALTILQRQITLLLGTPASVMGIHGGMAGRSVAGRFGSALDLYCCTIVHTLRCGTSGIPRRRKRTQQKHGVRFADAVSVFADDAALTLDDPHPDEERYVTIGMDALARIVVVVYTWRGEETIRIISARRATRNEHDQYRRGEP